MLKLVLRNLMSNAIKYSGDGGVIKIYSERTKNKIRISVSDIGVGISEDMKNKIFTSQRVNTYGTSNEPGTGLGLMLCKEFLEKIGGSIWVESEQGKGSIFSFDIPLPS
jgi:signal transduction histidine kinase